MKVWLIYTDSYSESKVDKDYKEDAAIDILAEIASKTNSSTKVEHIYETYITEEILEGGEQHVRL
ncbi:hypothetical protein B7C51_24735 (plasmid) [Paenibacillus larvae subsp. pulvifaciens]|uniref:Uncharacterized protein n=1 Tax=Paenibacillus larvae subsp. pulvifaciens TaxID=1477 RepID=A0A1V0UZY7_9BACL|nr:hypothetical protein [Paenibacillus larvae]ARF70683.1 hypothetical protein B7C51_24735 [Paenibacillus larvae subsp. pulvifaciens]